MVARKIYHSNNNLDSELSSLGTSDIESTADECEAEEEEEEVLYENTCVDVAMSLEELREHIKSTKLLENGFAEEYSVSLGSIQMEEFV